MTEENYDGIAIVGMAGRFPGAESVEELWLNLIAGKESLSFFSDEELAESGLDAKRLRSGGHYVAARGILKDADCFDSAFFGVHPREADVMDPQQRLFLEVCWAALEHAGYAPNTLTSGGVFAGATFNTYHEHVLLPRPDLLELIGHELVMFGNEKDYLATRVAYKFGLKGPAINVSTACSTGLVAVAQACQSLLLYQCDAALAGGSSVTVPQKRGYYHDEGNIGSADGHTRTFDAQSSGTAFSNGVAVVVLKRLADAVNDGDRIYAVIKAAALNNDGAQRVSFGAPGVEGQSEVIAMAHALAGVDPETITYVEAHGTATPLGDPIEVAALTKAFRLGTQAKQFCGLGSLKSNLGHLDVAAGVTGLIKVALSLHHRVLPPSLNFTTPNPKLDLENSPFFVNATLQDWLARPGTPRRAAVSSFGTGGTNAHVVLEEAPDLAASGPSRPWQLLLMSAKTLGALDRATTNLSQHLKRLAEPGSAEDAAQELADTAFTLQTGRSAFIHRRIVACSDAVDASAALETNDAKRVFTYKQQLNEPPVVFMFPGQGAQYPGMGASLYRCEPVFRDTVDRCAELLRPLLQMDLRTVLFPARGSDKDAAELLKQTRLTQPALFTIEYSLAKLWMSWGIRPTAMIGHSVGEYVAGCLAGVFSLDDVVSLVARRGALVQEQPGGAMLAVRLPEKDVVCLLHGQMAIAAVNAPSLCVVAGPFEAIADLEQHLGTQGVVTRHLHTSHAFHSPMMEPVLAPFTELLRNVKLSEPKIPYVSNVTAQWITPADATSADYWASHVRDTVRFADGLTELTKDPRNILLEVGPGQTLTTLARQHPSKAADQLVLASLPLTGDEEPRGILETLGRLWMAGAEVDWQGFYAEERRRRTVLPTYPFERKRHWPDSVPAAAGHSLAAAPAVLAEPSAAAPMTAPTPTPAPSMVVVPEETAVLASPVPRKERLLAGVRSLLQDLSGSDLSAVDSSIDLLELGLDSLLLTQAATLFQRKFGVHITFRQLMEELNSLDVIASYLDEKLPQEAFAAPVPAAPAAASAPAAVPEVLGPVSNQVLQQLLQQQQQLTTQLLQLMGQQTAVQAPMAPAAHAPAPSPSPASTSAKPEVRHGPFRPIDKSASQAMSPRQTRAIDELVARYTRRTAASKKLVAANRPMLADPRSVAGFNRLWKEMVYPIVTNKSDGSKIWDVDGNEYVDFVMGFGASLFGHRPKFVVDALQEQLDRGFETGPIHPLAGEVAALLRELTGMERFGFTNTGSEAVLAATRVARTVTGRDKIAVFAGAYHGIFDEVLFRPATVAGEPGAAAIAPGIPGSSLAQVVVLDFGNPESLDYLRRRGSEIAAVLVEPVQARRLDLQPAEFLRELRSVTEQTGTALVFDEVVTGFRVAPGGAQAHFGIRADLATYGKVIGGGIPIGVVSGAARFMDALDGGQWQYGDASFPEVGVTFFAGTFVRHPLMLAATKAVLTHLKQQGPELQSRLADRTARFANELRALVKEFDAPYHLTQFSSLMHLTFAPEHKLAGLLFYLLRDHGIHTWENRLFVMTTAHTEEDLARLTRAMRASLQEMRDGELLLPPSGKATSSAASARDGNQRASREEQPVLAAASRTRFPLTEAQKEIWLAAQMGGDAAVAYNESLNLQFRGRLDVELFRAAVKQVVQRHPILLASVSEDGEWQRLSPDTEPDVPLLDFSADAENVRDLRLTEVIDRETSQGFDLVRGPLLRVRIVRMSPEHHVVIWTAHHIVCDGWSAGLLMSELAKTYSARKQGRQPELETPVAFSEYALASLDAGPEAAESLAYWRERLSNLPPPAEFPTDRPRGLARTARAATARRNLSTLQRPIKQAAAQFRTTQVVLLLAGLKTLLYRLTGQPDLVVGLGVAGQAVTGKTCLVGHCVNLLPIRTQLDSEASFQDVLAVVKKGVMDGLDHHQSTLGGILRHLKVSRSPSHPPVVEVVFNLDRDPGEAHFEGLEFVCARNPKRALHFDLFFNFVDGPRGLSVECDYNTDLFDAATIDRWLGHYQTLIESIAASPTEGLARLPILTGAERAALMEERNQTRLDVPVGTVADWFERQAKKTPDQRAVSFGDVGLTYGELDRRANLLARRLRAMGVGPDVLVGLLIERSLDMIVALLGVMKAGGAYLPLDPSFPQDRLAYMVEDSRMALMITHRDLDQKLTLTPEQVLRLDADLNEIDDCRPLEGTGVSADTLAYVLYTSGSTGRPKGVEIPHRALSNLVCSIQQNPGFTAADTMLAVTTLSFDIAGPEIYLPLVSGGHLVIASREEALDPILLMALMGRWHCTVMDATPATWQALVDVGWAGVSDLKLFCTGEAFPRNLAAELLSRCRELWNLYGPTETTVWSTIHRVTSAESSIPIGRPVGNTQVFVLDAHRQLVPQGVIGELYIGGAGLARGYLRRPELTVERFVASPFQPDERLYRTGDLVRWLPDGVLECLGRVDTQVKIRGFRIELGEVETMLGRHEAVGPCVVVAREDASGDKRLVAYFEPAGTSPWTAGDLREHLRKDLPEYMIPSSFVVLDRLPLTPSGKVDRKALPAPEQGALEADVSQVGPRDALELALTSIWTKVLKVPSVGIHDNFFDLGGHSLAAVILLSEIRKLTGRTLPLATLFQAGTVAEFAEILRQDGWEPSWSSLVPIRPAGSRMPLFLVHGAEGNVLLYRTVTRYLGSEQPVYGLQSRGLNGKKQPAVTVQEMAAEYITEMMSVQPSGPYHLGGYCMGGVIALEMAQQLAAMGERAELVMMLDTYNGSADSQAKSRLLTPLHLVQNVWFHCVNAMSLSGEDRRKFLNERFDVAVTRLKILSQAALQFFGTSADNGHVHLTIKNVNHKALQQYVPQAYSGRVAVIRSKGHFAGFASPTLGWDGLLHGRFEVHEVPVYFGGMLVDPYARRLAETVKVCMGGARPPSQSTELAEEERVLAKA